jgi:peptide-methionine (S)-S-oxide reductase
MPPISPEQALPGRDAPMPVAERHLVLGTPLEGPWPEGHEVVYFAMGCFWGAERIFWQVTGVYSTAVGYMGGFTRNPTYEETCTGRTGHTETVQVVYDPRAVSLEVLLKAFWENHDPTTPDRQGNDVGTQYRSAIYTTTEEQLTAAQASADRYQRALADAGYGRVSTEIEPVSEAGDGTFYYAEDYHQAYLHVHPHGYCNHGYCQTDYPLSDHGQAPSEVSLPDG